VQGERFRIEETNKEIKTRGLGVLTIVMVVEVVDGCC
jgi:hypothetical protein